VSHADIVGALAKRTTALTAISEDIVAKTAQPQQQPSERGPKRERRRAARQERRPIDGPVRQSFDAEDLLGESQFSAEQAGERSVARRISGGPPSDEPFGTSADSDLGRRYLEEATQSPGQEHYEPGADFETELEAASSSYNPDDDIDLEAEAAAAFEEDDDLPARRR
jgi:hypothetical protein